MGDSTLSRLVNAPFEIEWNGKKYPVRKASLIQVAQYQERVRQYIDSKEAGSDAKLAAFCLWLVLKEADPTLTEDFVGNNTPGDIDILSLLLELGFLKPTKETATPEVPKEEITTTEGSSPS